MGGRMAKSVDTIKVLEKKIKQVEARISAQRFLARKKDTQIKRSLGRVFLLSGIAKIVDTSKLTPQETIIIGGLAKASGLNIFKLSQFLGAINITVRACHDMIFIDECKKIGEYFYTDEKKLSYPFTLFLGIMVKANQYLTNDDNIQKAHEVGNVLFEHHRAKQSEKRLNRFTQKTGKNHV